MIQERHMRKLWNARRTASEIEKQQSECIHWLKPLRRHSTYRYVCIKCDKKLKKASGIKLKP